MGEPQQPARKQPAAASPAVNIVPPAAPAAEDVERQAMNNMNDHAENAAPRA
jgi:hypothetical protein